MTMEVELLTSKIESENIQTLNNSIGDVEYISFSIPLKFNPIYSASIEKREKYIFILKYFCQKYSHGQEYADSLVSFFSNELGIKKEKPRGNLNLSKINKYRYFLLLDILFINAFDDKNKAKSIIQYFKEFSKHLYDNKIEVLYNCLFDSGDDKRFDEYNRKYIDLYLKNLTSSFVRKKTILFTANMSAGKSTLINALVGKKVCKSQNEACTAKIHKIYSKPFEDGYIAEYDNILNLSADEVTLMTDDAENKYDYLSVGSYFNFSHLSSDRLVFIDTPGVNSSLDIQHKEITERYFKSNYFDYIVYVINGQQIATDDDARYISQLVKEFPNTYFVFVLNKLDSYHSEDNIKLSVSRVKNDCVKLNVRHFSVCPVSAFAGFTAKLEPEHTKPEFNDFYLLSAKFNKPEYNLSGYYSSGALKKAKEYIESATTDFEKTRRTLIVNCGLFGLEYVLNEGV